MTDKEMFRIWAPVGKRWTDWVRPVPFVQISKSNKGYYSINKSVVSAVNREKNERAAIIIDLPGVESIVEGIALANTGYRPIPIYNGTFEQEGARATVDNQAIRIGLAWGANELTQIEIDEEALPVFLVDSNRMNRYKMEEALFDNSWDVYPQDLPSAEYLISGTESFTNKAIVSAVTGLANWIVSLYFPGAKFSTLRSFSGPLRKSSGVRKLSNRSVSRVMTLPFRVTV
jgi:hypothetical protein